MTLVYHLFCFAIPMVILSWILPKKYVLQSQIICTGLFVLYESPLSFALLTFVAIGNFYLLHHTKLKQTLKIGISILFLALLLLAIKITIALEQNWVVPLGISYYAFRNIHYTLEFFKDKIKNPNLLFYLSYNFFLPVFIVGPINRYADFVKDWQRRRFNQDYFSDGLQRILYGLSKIVILGNYLFTFKANLFIKNLDPSAIWLQNYIETIRFVLNAYFQFAGYSDIAIGLSLLMGYRITENFNYPFLTTNMRDFWTKYHMSLSSFCKDYIYTPISSYYRKPLLGVGITMIVIAMWHEISIRYLIWGILQAIAISAGFFFQQIPKNLVSTFLGRLFVLHFFACSGIIISHESLASAIETYKILFLIS